MEINPRVAIIGEYKFLSPYHKRKTYLPFTVLGVDRELQTETTGDIDEILEALFWGDNPILED